MQRLAEEAAHGAGALAAPQIDEVVVGIGRRERVDRRREQLQLEGEQWLVVEAGALAQEELDEQLGADVAQVLHGTVHPPLRGAAAGEGWREHDPVAAPPGSVTPARDQRLVDEPIDGSIGERSAQCPDPAELPAGSEHRAHRPAVGDLLRDEREADPLGERQPKRRVDRCRPSSFVSSSRGNGHDASIVRNFLSNVSC